MSHVKYSNKSNYTFTLKKNVIVMIKKKNTFIVMIFKVLEIIIILLKYKTGIMYTQINIFFKARSPLK